MNKKFLVFSILPLILSSCSCSQNSPEPNYESKSINVYYTNRNSNTTVDIRYYEGSVIPYISIKDYNQLLYRGRTYEVGRDKFEVTKVGNKYNIEVASNGKATFDIKENTFSSSDLWLFKNTNLQGTGSISYASYDGLPFTRVKSVTFDKDPEPFTLKLSDYHLKIYGDNSSLYVPLTFASDLFSNENILTGAYTGKNLYIFNFTENESLDTYGEQYYEEMYSSPLNQEYQEYYYNELCLDYDNFLGRPGRSSLEVYYDLSNGLDHALESRPLGKIIKRLLKSTKLEESLAGMYLLGLLRNDGGHSGYNPTNVAFYKKEGSLDIKTRPSWLNNETLTEINNIITSNSNYEEITNYDKQFSYRKDIYKARHNKLGKTNGVLSGTETYTKDGDIAYIHIDGFMGEIGLQDEWKEYYKGTRDTIPFGDNLGGAVGAIYTGLTKASSDSQIKHIVIDLAANTGGSTDEMLYMINLLTGSNGFYNHNTISKNNQTCLYEFDKNFDRKFDEEDDKVDLLKGRDVTVLTTRNGFSCGGISPIYLHDEGLFTIGEECGGGSCSVYMQYDAYGNLNRSSSPSMTTTKDKVNIDIARKTVCDHKMTFRYNSSSNSYNYSNLYDTSTLRMLIEAHYSK